MAISKGLDVADVERGLTCWLATHLADGRATDVSIPPGTGGSHETVIFTARWTADGLECHDRLVARVAPVGPQLFPVYDLEREFRLIKALAEESTLPVPDVRWFERDPTYIGAPFMTMPFIGGRTLGDDPPFTAAGWFVELPAARQAEVHDNALRVMAELHSLDPDAIVGGWLGSSSLQQGSGVVGQLATLRRFYDWAADGRSYSTIEAALDWASRNLPTDSRRAVVWGDARLANVIVADDLTVVGALDWELACVGDPEFDLGWWIFMNRHHTEGFGLPRPAGMPSDEETVRRYEELTGHPVRNLDFHLVLAGVLLCTLMVRVAQLMIAAGIVPADSTMAENNPAAQMLGDMLGLPRPGGGQAETFTGVFTERDDLTRAS